MATYAPCPGCGSLKELRAVEDPDVYPRAGACADCEAVIVLEDATPQDRLPESASSGQETI